MPSGGLVRPKGDHYALTSPHLTHGLAQPRGRAPIAALNPNGILTPAGAPITDASLPILLLRGSGPWGVPVVSLRCDKGGREGRRHRFQGKIAVSRVHQNLGTLFVFPLLATKFLQTISLISLNFVFLFVTA